MSRRKPKPRRGRPPIDNAATETVRLRVTPDVREQWARAAASAGITLSEWLREAAELALRRPSASLVQRLAHDADG